DKSELELLFAQAQEMGLDGEAGVYAWRLLIADRANAGAHDFLGARKRGQGWVLPLQGRWVDWEKRHELSKDWGSCWELSSLHYELQSNIPLPRALDTMLDIERLYRAFFELIGPELGIYDVCHPMKVHVHADDASYPEVSSEAGYYDPETDVLSLKAERGFDCTTLAHELTHQLLQDTAFREKNRDGCIPAWLNEGLAEYMAAGVKSTAPLVFEAGRANPQQFQEHARAAKEAFDLTRVLSFSAGDFDAGTGRSLKYAESYTLVHFLLHGLKGRYRPGFFDFLRDVYAGKGSSTDLRNALDVDWRQLQKDWDLY